MLWYRCYILVLCMMETFKSSRRQDPYSAWILSQRVHSSGNENSPVLCLAGPCGPHCTLYIFSICTITHMFPARIPTPLSDWALALKNLYCAVSIILIKKLWPVTLFADLLNRTGQLNRKGNKTLLTGRLQHSGDGSVISLWCCHSVFQAQSTHQEWNLIP